MGKVYTRFQTKKAQKPYPMGRHIPIYTYMAYIREYPPDTIPKLRQEKRLWGSDLLSNSLNLVLRKCVENSLENVYTHIGASLYISLSGTL